MLKKLTIGIIITILTFFTAHDICSSFVDYVINTDRGITVTCDPQPNYHFEWCMKDEDRNIWYDLYKGPSNTITVNRPKSGHFSIWVRACLPFQYTDETCSKWTISSDDFSGRSVRIDGTLGGWRVYWKPLPPKIIQPNGGN